MLAMSPPQSGSVVPSTNSGKDVVNNGIHHFLRPQLPDANSNLQRSAPQARSEPDNSSWCPFMNDCDATYEKLVKVGQGTYGEVFKARHRITHKAVALKKVLMENEREGFPITSLREIKILQLLKHENIVNMIEICKSNVKGREPKAVFYMVFDFCEHDLAGILSNVSIKFTLGEIKRLMQQLLNGMYFLHSNKILHRDMKAANVLITKTGVLKLADFGLARAISSKPNQINRYTNRVVTLWYRPPELLLGERNYGPAIDMWGVGCIMAEMWTRTPILQGTSEQQQLTLISQLCGSITPETMPGVENLELYKKLVLPEGQKRKVKQRLASYIHDAYALDLLDKLFALDPNKRIDTDTALNHDFFWTDPMPCDLSKMLSHCNQSMFEFTVANQRRMMIAQQQQRNGNRHMSNLPQSKRLCLAASIGNNSAQGAARNMAAENYSQYHDRVF